MGAIAVPANKAADQEHRAHWGAPTARHCLTCMWVVGGQVRRVRAASIVGMETSIRRMVPGHAALRRGRSSCPGQVYHLTITTKARAPIFRHFEAACAASRCFQDVAVLDGATLMAWVLMPDHAHWLLQLGDRHSLAGMVNRLKSASARSINVALDQSGPIWNRAFHDHAVRSDEDVRMIARYIIANPVRAGLVSRVGRYPFWNAIWL